jgi:hypothetical protein
MKENAVLVPTEANPERRETQLVYVTDGEAATKIEITTGLIGSGVTEVLSGLTGGETLVVKGQSYLKDGDLVRIVGGEEQAA